MNFTQVLEKVKGLIGLAPQQLSGSAEVLGDAIDRNACGNGHLVLSSGASSGTPDSFSMATKVYHCATSGGSYVDSGITVPAITAINTLKEVDLPLEGLNRYLKIGTTPTFVGGTSPKLFWQATVLLGDAEAEPIA